MCYGLFLPLGKSLSQDSEARLGTMEKFSLSNTPSLGAELSAEKGDTISILPA